MNVFVADPTLADLEVGQEVEVMDREIATAEDLFGAVGVDATTLAADLPLEAGAEPASSIH